MRTALVTGATGFIGGNLARELLKKERHVRVLARPESDLRNLDGIAVETFTGDLRDAASLARAVDGCDEVYHVAADYRFWAADTQEIYKSNVEGTRNLLETCLRARVPRVVYTSTVGTIGLSKQPEPCDETTAMDPAQVTSHYKASKIQAEEAALSFVARGLNLVVVNPSAPIGPWDRKPTPTGKMIVDFVNGKMPAYVETGLNFVHVRDVALGQIAAAEKGRCGERYILGNRNLTLGEFLEVLSKITGRPAPKARIPYAAAYAAGWVSTRFSDWVTHRAPAVPLEAVKMSKRYMFFDPSKAVRELGLPQTPVEEAARDAVEWFSENGYFKSAQFQNFSQKLKGSDSWEFQSSRR